MLVSLLGINKACSMCLGVDITLCSLKRTLLTSWRSLATLRIDLSYEPLISGCGYLPPFLSLSALTRK